MNFYDTIASMGYVIQKEESQNIIHIVKSDDRKDTLIEVHVFFDKENKTVQGVLRPKDLFYDLDDMVLIYKLYREMKKDVEFLADKSKYDIITKRGH